MEFIFRSIILNAETSAVCFKIYFLFWHRFSPSILAASCLVLASTIQKIGKLLQHYLHLDNTIHCPDPFKECSISNHKLSAWLYPYFILIVWTHFETIARILQEQSDLWSKSKFSFEIQRFSRKIYILIRLRDYLRCSCRERFSFVFNICYASFF